MAAARPPRSRPAAACDGQRHSARVLSICCNRSGYSGDYIRCGRQVAMALSSALYLESKQNFPPFADRTCLALFVRQAGRIELQMKQIYVNIASARAKILAALLGQLAGEPGSIEQRLLKGPQTWPGEARHWIWLAALARKPQIAPPTDLEAPD